jgi:hypothetical protein
MKKSFLAVLGLAILASLGTYALSTLVPWTGLANRIAGRQPEVQITYCLE